METLPRWNMDSLYGDVDSPAFKSDLEKEQRESLELEKELEDGSVSLLDAIYRYEMILDIDESLCAFASALRTTDTSNAAYGKAVCQAEEAGLEVQKLHVTMLSFLAKHKDEIEELTKPGKELADYHFVLEEALDEQKHTMDSKMEALAADLNRSGTDAFSRLQESVSATATVEWTSKEKMTATALRSLAFSPDRVLRKVAFDKELEIWDANKEAFAAALNGVKGATLTLDKARGYKSPLERSLLDARIDETTFHALISTLEEGLPMFRGYLATKAKVLSLDKLAFYDLFAPVGGGGRKYSYAEAQKFVIEKLGKFSPKMGAFVTKAFKQGWVDPEAHPGKVGGAYDTAFPRFGESRVLSNFDYSYNGVSTLAHELGHAFHDSIVLPQSHLLRTYPMTLAETASIFSETIALNGALEHADMAEKVTLEEHFIQDACQVCVDILCRFLFEQEVFNRRQSGELTADEFSSLMVDCQKQTYGDLSEYHPYMWAVKSHYYSSDFSFYNYPYAFGQLFALGLYAEYRQHPSSFEEKYVSLLSKTGRMSAESCAATIGVDLHSKAFWQQGMGVIGDFIQRFAHDSAV